MFLGTLGASWSENLLTNKRTTRAGEGRPGLEQANIFKSGSSFNKFWKTKGIIKMNINLMVYIQEIIYLQ